VKIVFLFLVPVVLVYAFASAVLEPRPRSGLRRVAQVAALGAALNLMWYLPDWTHGGPLGTLSELRDYTAASATFVLRRALRAFGVPTPALAVLVSCAFAGFVLFRIWRVRDLSLFLRRVSRDALSWLLIFAPVVYPWYALPMFPPVLTAGVRSHVAALLVFSACSMLTFYDFRLATGTHGSKYVNFLIGVLPALLVFLYGFRYSSRSSDAHPGRL
jgi:hypothetical protein